MGARGLSPAQEGGASPGTLWVPAKGLPWDLAQEVPPVAPQGFIFVEFLRKRGEAGCSLALEAAGAGGELRGLGTSPVPLWTQQQRLAALSVGRVGVQDRTPGEVAGFGAPSCKPGLRGGGSGGVWGPGVQGGGGVPLPKD